MNMDSEIQNFIKIWLTAIVSIIFCHQIARQIPSGTARLVSLLPIIYLFTILPLPLSSIYLGFSTISFLVWLGNFKLLLFAFDQGPLSTNPPLPLLHFIPIALLPIKTKQTPSPQSLSNEQKIFRRILFLLKCGLLTVVIVSLCKCREFMHPYLISFLNICHLYLGLELFYAVVAAPVRALLGLELELQFNEPYLATSLQDFWGRRWNLAVSNILRVAIYDPVRRISRRILGRRWAPAVAVLVTFLVSGLMHEVIYYYVARARPTWEVTWYLISQGFLVVAEVALKKALNGRWRLHTAVSWLLTMAIVVVTAMWLHFPLLIRCEFDLKVINEYYSLVRFVRDKIRLIIPS